MNKFKDLKPILTNELAKSKEINTVFKKLGVYNSKDIIKEILNTKEFENKFNYIVNDFSIIVDLYSLKNINANKDKIENKIVNNLKASAVDIFLKELNKYINIKTIRNN